MSTRIVSLDEPCTPETSRPDPARLVAGRPEQRVWNHFTDASGQFFAGRWSSTPGAWRVTYTENELCYILAGRVRITDANGVAREFAAGDSFVVPAGFAGTWEVLEECTKLYAIFEPVRSSGAAS